VTPSELTPQPAASPLPEPSPPDRRGGDTPRLGFVEDFRRFFLRGLAALLPTLITLGLLIWIWDFLWNNVGFYVIYAIKWGLYSIYKGSDSPYAQFGYIGRKFNDTDFSTRLLGVVLAVLLIYVVGVFVGNLLGRTAWRLAEVGVLKIPLVSAIYPAVKQITDFLLSERTEQFQGSAVVAVEPHEKGIWSIGLVTGPGLRALASATGQEMITVFVPSSPTAFSGYVLVVPRESVIELPLKVEEAMRLLVSGGVITPEATAAAAAHPSHGGRMVLKPPAPAAPAPPAVAIAAPSPA
jgi:uncharacterized membrane protein